MDFQKTDCRNRKGFRIQLSFIFLPYFLGNRTEHKGYKTLLQLARRLCINGTTCSSWNHYERLHIAEPCKVNSSKRCKKMTYGHTKFSDELHSMNISNSINACMNVPNSKMRILSWQSCQMILQEENFSELHLMPWNP